MGYLALLSHFIVMGFGLFITYYVHVLLVFFPCVTSCNSVKPGSLFYPL